MRQIKFRAWDAEQKRMFYPGDKYTSVAVFKYDKHTADLSSVDIGEGSWEWEVYGINWRADAQDKQPLILMQCTGLKDKDGKDIYEGDRLRRGEMTTIVFWDEFSASFLMQDKALNNLPMEFREIGWKWQVAGNLYENPAKKEPA
ncbi:YopX family protein [Larkinella soli]|uniref:YopX family protein n=1 Tax=Larkinella soli TaxID=1770527 RepID=UPI000FFC1840|nr:YopX family protein [Larkinella soli]